MKITKSRIKELIKEELEALKEIETNIPEVEVVGEMDTTSMKLPAQRLLSKLQANQALKKQLDIVAASNDKIGKQQLVAWFTATLGLDTQKDAAKIRAQAKKIGAA